MENNETSCINSILTSNGKIPENFNKIDNINYITLEIMANSDTYNKYLKKNNLDHDAVLKSEKKFYRKRITAMAKDILNNTVNTNSDSPIDDIIINAFNN